MSGKLLSEISENECCKIRSINCGKYLLQRLIDLGMIEGTTVKCVKIAMGGSPIAFDIRGAVIALRKSDCNDIAII